MRVYEFQAHRIFSQKGIPSPPGEVAETPQEVKQIAEKLKIEGSANYVRVSELKRQAVQTLIDNVDHSQVLDYL